MRYKSFNIVIDAFALLLSFVFSLFLRFSFIFKNIDIEWYIYSFLIIMVTDLLVLYFKGLYEKNFSNVFEQVSIIFEGLIYSTSLYIIMSYSIKNTIFSRLTLGYFIILSFVFQVIGKYFILYLIKKEYSKGKGLVNTIVIGEIQPFSENLIKEIDTKHVFGLKILGVLSKHVENSSFLNCVGDIRDFKKIINEYNVKSIIITSKVDNVEEIIDYCLLKYISIYTLGNAVDLMNYPVEIVFIEDTPILKIKDVLISGTTARLKRLIDFMLSLFLIIILSPLLVLISILIKITSPGPILFKHKRLGLNGKLIDVYKFRTMVVNAQEVLEKILSEHPDLKKEYEETFKLKDDPRMTKIGKILRKTSLDELPQLFNVIKGDMSLVGPRPIVLEEINMYKEHGKYLLRVLPGVTGLWQVSGRNNVDYEERIKMDMQYIMNWNLWLDLNILFKTIPAVLKKDGAY
ncbi:sugar transferase [Thermoanaerobacterium sp. CMT5567-10]|uniref:sugar transferase n=1 Tax=Thermoanaerobacterium sp. CMT5567-10 TaxID=3061989 RepID=UPI0026DF0D04|nr:sugar transferase [Thermoanaerobacterium sp. CMT5567-10]WKV08534.1 sugar transferase [Thermoanaerobacterium sp. CMT5567-10]